LLWILSGIALSALLIGSIFYFLNKTENGTSSTNSIKENVAITKQQNNISAETTINETVSPTIEENTNIAEVTNESVSASIESTANSIRQQKQKADVVQDVPSVNTTRNEVLKQTRINTPIYFETEEKINPSEENKIEETKQNAEKAASSIDLLEKSLNTTETPPIAGISLQELTNKATNNVDEFATKTDLLKGPKSQFSFGIYASLDNNSLSLTKDKIEQGYRVGLRADYNFARRFSLGIGAAFSKKTYTAQGFRYNAKPGFWLDGIAPIEVEASCNIVEIPLELRFYAKGHDQDGFFAGAGINSYHMALEQYNFHYEDFCPDAINDWEERGTNTNLFSVAAFTFGYQKTVNKNMAIQIAPYLNLPITGIGQGGVNLQSAGLNVAVNWRK